MGRCKFPIYLTRDKADAWFDMWGIINETRMTRNSWTFLGLNFDSLSPSLQMFRTMAERNQYRIRARYLRAMTSGGTSADMEDVPDAQDRGDDDIDDEWPVTDSTVHLSLPPEIALSLSATNPQWTSTSGKRSRDILTTSSVKASRLNEQILDHAKASITSRLPPVKASLRQGLPLSRMRSSIMSPSIQRMTPIRIRIRASTSMIYHWVIEKTT